MSAATEDDIAHLRARLAAAEAEVQALRERVAKLEAVLVALPDPHCACGLVATTVFALVSRCKAEVVNECDECADGHYDDAVFAATLRIYHGQTEGK